MNTKKNRLTFFVAIIIYSVFFTSNAHSLSPHLGFNVSTGFILDDFPLPVATKKIFVIDVNWDREILLTRPKGMFSCGYRVGILGFFALPIPHVSFYCNLFPPDGIQIALATGIFYDFIYGGLMSLDFKIGIEIKDTVSLDVTILPTLVSPTFNYPEQASDITKPIKRYNKYSNPPFPDTLFGIMISYKFKLGEKK